MARSPNIVTAVGNAKISTAQFKFGTASAVFDGAGDYLSMPDAAGVFDFGTGNFTVEGWFRFTDTTTDVCLFGGPSQTSSFDIRRFSDNTIRVGRTNTAWDVISSGNVTVTNTWTHIAISRSGTTLRIYVNGAQRASASNSINYQINTTAYIGGRPTEAFLNGYIDEFRVSNVARYTAAFTPSTTRFVGDANTLLLLHMDGANNSTVFTDDVGSAQEGAAVISATASLGATSQRNRRGTAAISSTSTLTATPQRIRNSATNMAVVSNTVIIAGRIIDVNIAFESLFSPGVTVEVLKNSFAVLEVISDLSNTISKIAGNQSLLEALIDLQLQGVRIRDLNSAISAGSDITISSINIKSLAIELYSAATFICSVDKLVTASAAMESTTQTSVTARTSYTGQSDIVAVTSIVANAEIAVPNKEYIDLGYIDYDYFEFEAPVIESAVANLTSEFTTAVAGNKIAGLDSDLTSNFVLSAQSNVTKEFNSTLSSVSNITVDSTVYKSVAAALVAETTLTAETEEISGITINLVATSSVAAQISKILNAQVSLPVAATVNCVANSNQQTAAELFALTTLTGSLQGSIYGAANILSAMTASIGIEIDRAGTAALTANTTMAVQAEVFSKTTCNMQSTSSMSIQTDKLSVTSANLQVMINMTVDNRELGIVPERTYKVPFENRTYLIPNENRIYRIPGETRTWKVI